LKEEAVESPSGTTKRERGLLSKPKNMREKEREKREETRMSKKKRLGATNNADLLDLT